MTEGGLALAESVCPDPTTWCGTPIRCESMASSRLLVKGPVAGTGTLAGAWDKLNPRGSPRRVGVHDGVRALLGLGNTGITLIGDYAARAAARDDPQQDIIRLRVWKTIVLCADRPIQVRIPDRYVWELGSALAYPLLNRTSAKVTNGITWACVRNGCIPHKEQLLGVFPRKPHPQAGRKANVFLDLLLGDVLRMSQPWLVDVAVLLSKLAIGEVTDDQICSCILWAVAVAHDHSFRLCLAIALGAVTSPDRAKALSDVLKATGLNGSLEGARLCEMHTLLGRGIESTDLWADAKRRLAGSLDIPLARPPSDELEAAISDIIREELDHKVVLPAVDSFWAQRYKWCVGGSHNLGTNEHWLPADRLPGTKIGCRWNRRAASEAVNWNPLPSWDGRVDVSVAVKLEHGKSRAIYSCDTLSYYAFTWLLRPVEEAWASRRVILDPGRDGMLGMFNRIRRLAGNTTSPVFAMLDYSDFNSQHTIESQQTVIKCLLRFCVNVDSKLAETLVRSFENMNIHMGGKIVGKVAGSLMSGHRATTLINSILNAAYVRCALGAYNYKRIRSLHVGDDVLMIVPDEGAAWDCIKLLEAQGCTLQPSKQSVGRACFEFLRMSGHPQCGGYGYLARSVAGLVSGNWVTDYELEPLEGLHSLVHQCRSLINRSGSCRVWEALLGSVEQITGLPATILGELLSGEVAIAPGPCYRKDGRYISRVVEYTDLGRLGCGTQSRFGNLPRHASWDYVYAGCSAIERMGIELAGFVPWQSMALSCYGTMELSSLGVPGVGSRPSNALRYGGRECRHKRGLTTTDAVTTSARRYGLLAHHPILSLLRNVLDRSAVHQLLVTSGQPFEYGYEFLHAWGGAREGATIDGIIPYSDAAGLGSRELASSVHVSRPIHM